MKILAFVDLHGNEGILKKIIRLAKNKKVDIIINAGDISMFGRGLDYISSELNKVNIPVLMIPGNHETNKEIKDVCSLFKNLEYIHKKAYRVGDILILGFGGGGFSLVDKEFEKLSKSFEKKIKKKDKVLLVTHAPPYGTKIDKLYKEHVGNKSILKFIKKTKPDVAVSGHLHELSEKEDKVGKTRVINPGPSGKIIEL